MNKGSTVIWLIIILAFLLPTSFGRFFIDMAGGIIVLIILLTLLISGVSWLSWRSIKTNIKNCQNCGASYFTDSAQCPICGSKEKLEDTKLNDNSPASSATIDVVAETTD